MGCRRLLQQYGRPRFNPWVRKIPCRREWLCTPVFLPGESHGQKGLAGYSPQGCKESDATEALQHTSTQAPRLWHPVTTVPENEYNSLHPLRYMEAVAKSFQSCPTLCSSLSLLLIKPIDFQQQPPLCAPAPSVALCSPPNSCGGSRPPDATRQK